VLKVWRAADTLTRSATVAKHWSEESASTFLIATAREFFAHVAIVRRNTYASGKRNFGDDQIRSLGVQLAEAISEADSFTIWPSLNSGCIWFLPFARSSSATDATVAPSRERVKINLALVRELCFTGQHESSENYNIPLPVQALWPQMAFI